MGQYVSLHRHDALSLYDGLDLAVRAAEYAKKLEQPALALTNHGNVFGLVDHYHVCVDAGLKPILGMEAYITLSEAKPDKEKGEKLHHQTILVENETGYRNLMKLVSMGYDLFYYKPRITLKQLRDHQEGLIILSGCPSSLIQYEILNDNPMRAERLFAIYANWFHGRFYAEIQHHELAKKTTPVLYELAERYNVPLVVTNDAHYTEPADKPIHDLLLRLRGKDKGEEDPTYGAGFHIATYDEMFGLMATAHPWMGKRLLRNALEETVRIADRVSFSFEKKRSELPAFWDEPDRRLRVLAARGLQDRGLGKRPDYVAQVAHELDVVHKLGVSTYFLICEEVTSWARQHGILIGPRGSVCGSMLAFVLGVTFVDPIKHGTMFERFLHAEKTSYPDVDLDIDSRYRETVSKHVIERYAPHAVPIITFGRYSGGNISNDLFKAFPEQIDDDTKRELRIAIDHLKANRIYAATEDDLDESIFPWDDMEYKIPGFRRIVMKLYGAPRYIGKHPGGVCFVPGELTHWMGKVRSRDGVETTCYPMVDVEYLGLLKFDFLGLGAIGTLSSAIQLIAQRHEQEEQLALTEIPLDDADCYQQFASGNTDGIFQFESRGGRAILREIEPERFEELAASTALNRPGVSDNLPKYIEGKGMQGHSPFLARTYGAIVYQEQIVAILRSAGMTWGDCDAFLKAIKTKAAKSAAQQKPPVIEKLEANLIGRGASAAKAHAFVETIRQYSFNMAHAVGYALVAYWEMWLRRHYPMEFWTSVLNMERDEKKRAAYESAAVNDGCVLFPPHVNGSYNYSIEGNAIRVGIASLKGVGPKAAEVIAASGPYKHAQDIRKLPRRIVNVRVVKALLEAGAVDMNEDRLRKRAVEFNVQRKQMTRGVLLWGGRSSE